MLDDWPLTDLAALNVPEYALCLLRVFPDAAILVSAAGRILAANATAQDALGLASEQPDECDLATLTDDDGQTLAATLDAWSRSNQPTPGAFTATLSAERTVFHAQGGLIVPPTDGTAGVLLVRFWPSKDTIAGVLTSRIALLEDEVTRLRLTEDALRRREVTLRQRVDEAEALTRAKDDFLATVSHELRAPLNAILGWSSLLQRHEHHPEVAKALVVIRRNAEAQAKLVDDILDVSRVITGKFILETTPCDLASTVEETIEVMRPAAAASHIRLQFARPPGPCLLVADPDRFRQVVGNLLSNAVKFTEKGGAIRVEVACTPSQFTLTVVDTGRGIAPSFLPFVFERFRQGDESSTRRAGGLGLGLSLVRHIVELHGGEVRAFSEGPGQGATFTVRLPIREGPQRPVPADDRRAVAFDSQRPEGPRLQGLRVLIVEDDIDASELLAAVLAQAGGNIETVGSAAEALVSLASFRPHVLVSDIGLPEEDGYSFIRRLRRRSIGEGGAIPSIALTAHARPEDRTRALAAGFTTHIGKPVNPDDLISAVANLAPFAPK